MFNKENKTPYEMHHDDIVKNKRTGCYPKGQSVKASGSENVTQSRCPERGQSPSDAILFELLAS